LFWKRPAQATTLQVGGARLEVEPVSDAWWVVDGQQRTTALAASLLDLDHGADARWSIYFDLESSSFEVGEPDERGPQVPLSVLGDLRRLGRWMRERALGEIELDRIEEAQQRILDYEIPAYIVETDNDLALRAVFARLNSTGARMRADEVFQALLGGNSARSAMDLNALQEACNLDGFGVPPRAEVMKAVLAMSGIDPTKRLEELGGVGLDGLVDQADAADALGRAIRFLMKFCGIPHVSLIPYPVVLIILARWFHLFPANQPPELRLLARWVWRGAVKGTHQRAAVSAMRLQVRALQVDEAERSLRRLLEKVSGEPSERWTLGRFDSRSARSRVEILALLSLNPRDPAGRVCLAALTSGGRVAREVFAARATKALDSPTRELAKTTANRVVLDTTHTGLATEIQRWEGAASADILASHVIDEIAYDALLNQDVARFLVHRASRVEDLVNRFIGKMAAWDEPELHSIDTYLDSE